MTHEELREKFIKILTDMYFDKIWNDEERKSAGIEKSERIKARQGGISHGIHLVMKEFFTAEERKEIKRIAKEQAQKEWDEE